MGTALAQVTRPPRPARQELDIEHRFYVKEAFLVRWFGRTITRLFVLTTLRAKEYIEDTTSTELE